LHHFHPNGVSGVAVLAESHISIHTWPDSRYAALDLFMCGKAIPDACIPVLRKAFKAKRVEVSEILRGQETESEDRRRRTRGRFRERAPSSASMPIMADKRRIPETLFDDIGIRMTYEVERVIYELQTEHQHLVLFEHPFFGKMLMLDGATQ